MKRTLLVLFNTIALGLFVTIAGCDSSTSEDGGTTSAPIAGTWQGTVDQPDYGIYEMVLTIREADEGDEAGTTSYTELECLGVIEYRGRDDGAFVFEEEIVEDPEDICISEGRIEVALQDTNTLAWQYFLLDSNLLLSSATLAKQ